MDPIDALDEIAFRLERELAPSFKIAAFRRAAAMIKDIAAADLAERINDGRLSRMKGIGDTTFEVIREAAAGQVPAYLAKLRESAPAAASPGALEGAIGSVIRGDLHTHTEWSDGTTPIEQMAAAAQALGREYIAVTDHSPKLKIAHGLSADRLADQLDVIAGLNDQYRGFRLLTGIEVDILEDGTLDQTPELLDRVELVVASAHSKLRSDTTAMTERMLRAVENPATNVLGHCTGRLLNGSRGTRPASTFDARRVFAACTANGVAVEINSRPERQDPPDDLLRLAIDAGCLFSIDSDAHAPGHLDFLRYGVERAEAQGVPGERVVTTWPVDRVLEWAGQG